MIARTDIGAELECAQRISGQLGAARQARGLSQKEAAYQLALSADQINCLENQSLKSFYSPEYYVVAAKKYAAFLGVTVEQPRASAVALPTTPVASSEQARPRKGKILKWRPLLWASAILVTILVGLAYVVRESGHERNARPATLPQTRNVLPPTIPSVAPHPEPAKAGVVALQLNFTAASWVSIYRRDGGHEQKVYGPQETLKLDLEPLTELIIGNAPATRLSIGKNEISLKRFTNPDSNVAHIAGQSLKDMSTMQP